MDFISVIIPSFNRAPKILGAINSVLNQSFKNFEIIVVDDGSTDETERVLSGLIKDSKIRYFKIHNSGVSFARNFGVAKSSAPLIAFLDSDDEWLPNKLMDQYIYLKNNPDCKIVYGQEIWIRNGLRVNQKKIHQKFGGHIFDKCVQQCFIGPSSVLLTKDLFYEVGGFDVLFSVCEDYDLWLKISSLYKIGFISTDLIIKYGGHNDQLSTKFKSMDLWRIKSLSRILSIRDLSEKDKKNVIDIIHKKAAILIKGYKKYKNSNSILEVEKILLDLSENRLL